MKLFALTCAVLLVGGPAAAIADQLDDHFQSLKDAEAKKDPDLIKKTAVETWQMADKEAKSAAPQDVDKDAWAKHVDYCHEIQEHAEYALLVATIGAQPATTVDLMSSLEQLNPKSKYMGQGYEVYFAALNQTGGSAKIPAIAEKALANFPDNDQLLAVAADSALSKQQTDRALTYANRLIAVLNKNVKPENLSAADWERKRSAELGSAYYSAGVAHGAKSQWVDCDKDLRAALPLIKGNNAMTAHALYVLGVANYQFGKMTNSKAKVLDGAKFSQQSAAIPGPDQQQAQRNYLLITDEANKMR
jgi:tetratricopeptide (TPR) repeat protein